MTRRLIVAVLPVACLLLTTPVVAQAATAPGTAPPAAPTGQVQLIQAVPGVTADLSVDGDAVDSDLEVGSIRPLELSPGKHDIVFTDSGGASSTASVKVAVGQNSDVVYHLPASLTGEPVLSTYRTPTKPIGPGKARVLVAHTATVAPADVEVDGQVVFNDIANGEFAEAEVPAGTRSVALLPAGGNGTPILGPIEVKLKPSTVTMVYAVGRPENGSMQVITRSLRISSDGTVVPDAIDTGAAGLVADVPVAPFGQQSAAAPRPSDPAPWPWIVLTAALVALLGVTARGRLAGRIRAARLPGLR